MSGSLAAEHFAVVNDKFAYVPEVHRANAAAYFATIKDAVDGYQKTGNWSAQKSAVPPLLLKSPCELQQDTFFFRTDAPTTVGLNSTASSSSQLPHDFYLALSVLERSAAQSFIHPPPGADWENAPDRSIYLIRVAKGSKILYLEASKSGEAEVICWMRDCKVEDIMCKSLEHAVKILSGDVK